MDSRYNGELALGFPNSITEKLLLSEAVILNTHSDIRFRFRADGGRLAKSQS
jgi:hypothetical protein